MSKIKILSFLLICDNCKTELEYKIREDFDHLPSGWREETMWYPYRYYRPLLCPDCTSEDYKRKL